MSGERAPDPERQRGAVLGRREESVGDHDPLEAVVVLGREPEAEQGSPVLADQRDPAQVDRLDPLAQPVDMGLVGVVGHVPVGLSDLPNPIRSGATARSPASAKTGTMWR